MLSLTASAARGDSTVPRRAATVREYSRTFTTYPFSDPNPIATVGRIYPYFRFDGFTDTPVQQQWKVVELENDYLKVMILPQIGGKIWTAIDKRTNRPFIYFNEVVKFRDIAMRGPWTSGGIEANYGIIGHTPNVATPVDYVTSTERDGSVVCTIGALDLLTRTPWRLTIKLNPNEARFSTTSFWYNASPLEEPYYSWMNAGIPVAGKLQFVYPGTSQLGHAGEHGPWPLDGGSRDLSYYDNNNFGGYKSYHVFGQATDFVGAYWHANDFGMVRYGTRDDKAGKKIWIWGLSRQGMIWEQLLTDTNGQYAEVQSGRLFNQSAEGSTFTPFKHRGFTPHTADRWTEYWYPVAGTKGIAAASGVGALNATIAGDRLILSFSPVQIVGAKLVVSAGSRTLSEKQVARAPLEMYVDTVNIKDVPRDSLRVVLGDNQLTWRYDSRSEALARPLDSPKDFNWMSSYGFWMRGKEWLRQREYDSARVYLDQALAKDANYVSALTDRGMLDVRSGWYDRALTSLKRALSVDTYDPAANYYYGLANRRIGKLADAKDGFEIAAQSPEYRGAAWTELAKLSLAQHHDVEARTYADKALRDNPGNLDALAMQIITATRIALRSGVSTRSPNGLRLMNAEFLVRQLQRADTLSRHALVEHLLMQDDAKFAAGLRAGIRAELPEQVMLELAAWYADVDETAVALKILDAAGDNPEALYWRGYLTRGTSASDSLIKRADAQSPKMVFPFRPEIEPVLAYAHDRTGSWKTTYYRALRFGSSGSKGNATLFLTELGDTPDFAPFYVTRASLHDGDPSSWSPQLRASVQHDLERAIALDSTEWRFGKALADYQLRAANPTAAVAVARRYATRFPKNYILGLTLAKSLVAAKQFAEADKLLSTLKILPYEGAKDGHTLYRETKLALAQQAIDANNWSAARTHISAAREWPERLGSGKPYDADLDERVEDSLLAVVNARSGATPSPQPPRADSLRYGTGVWEADSLGNHRAVLHVDTPANIVHAHIPWRRRDKTPQNVNLVVVSAAAQTRINNVLRVNITREAGDIAFEAPAAGDYYVYYLPYTGTFKSNYPKITYRLVENTASAAWEAQARGDRATPGNTARMVGFDAINAFSAFTPMEYIAGAAESDSLRTKFASAPFLAFPEDRSRSIRMADDIPHLWYERGPFQPFTANAKRGEFYSFQIGVWAHRAPIDSLRYRATSFARKGGKESIPASALTAFNLEGTDWSGAHFSKSLHVDKDKVQALWLGLDVPKRTVPGDYEGRVTLSARGAADQSVAVTFRVSADTVINHGDDNPQQLTRLRWLNSQLAVDDDIVAPYTPLKLAGNTISLLGRSLTFGADGMPTSIKSFFAPNNTSIGTTSREILAAPVHLAVRDANNKEFAFTGAAPRITKQARGAVAWETRTTSGALSLHSKAQLDFDGTAEYTVALKASQRTTLGNVTFELPLKADAAKYMMGLGQKGGYRPASFHWTWDVKNKNQDAAWLGDVNAGVQFTLKDEHYVRPLNTNFYLSKPLIAPTSWANDGKGTCDIGQQGDKVIATCSSGQHVINAGDSLRFDFRLMITPFKPLDTKGQWGTRFFHAFVPVDSIIKRGANTVNVHHANRINPWINYPFIETAGMRAYIDSSHAKGLKTKIYYTVRELTNHAPEIFALRSLGDEVLSHGPGGGYSWLQEHVGDDYIAAWHVPEIKDAAIVNSGVSRWHNFYIEGLDWLVKHERIDGLYLDDVAFDRITMKRIRKTLDRGNPGALLDLHSANQYNPRDGFASSANLYLEHFPFLNRLWFGEYFDYDSKPDYWLVEISGIPFGLMGEMLEKGGNPWRGMTMGMTARLPWSGDPAPLWKAWDAFGIQQSAMHGWWSGHDPVTTSDANVLATTWTKAGSAMISLGSWNDADVSVKLTIDWKALGMNPATSRIRAPAIDAFQPAGSWAPGDAITVPGKKGLVLLIEPR